MDIYNIKTGQKGYQVQGAAIPAGWTTAPVTPQVTIPTVSAPAAPLATVFKGYDYTGTTPELDSAIETGLTSAKNSLAPVDESAIRANAINQFQKEIDAVNQVYAEKRREAVLQGQNRVGTGTAIAARSGTLGSDFGAAQNDKIVNDNNSILTGLDAERIAKVEAINNSANSLAADEIKAKREAQTKGLDSYISFLGKKTERNTAKATAIAQSILASKLDPTKEIDPNVLKSVAEKNGITTDAILTSYATAKKTAEAAALEAEKTKAAIAKDSYQTVNEGDQIYKRNADGTLTLIGKNAKTFAPKATGVAGIGGSSTFKTDLDAIVGNTLATIPTKFGQATFQNQIGNARNDADKISTVASVVLKNAPAEVKTDFTNQTVGIRNIDKAIALLDNGVKTGVLQNGAQYLFNQLGKDYDPKLAAVSAYITSGLQPYRNSITGAAWGDQEDGEYASLFGSTKFSPTELKDRLERIKEIMKDKSAEGLNVYVNPLGTYDNYFTGAGGGNAETVTIRKPDGTTGTIPRANLEAALKLGATQI